MESLLENDSDSEGVMLFWMFEFGIHERSVDAFPKVGGGIGCTVSRAFRDE